MLDQSWIWSSRLKPRPLCPRQPTPHGSGLFWLSTGRSCWDPSAELPAFEVQSCPGFVPGRGSSHLGELRAKLRIRTGSSLGICLWSHCRAARSSAAATMKASGSEAWVKAPKSVGSAMFSGEYRVVLLGSTRHGSPN